MSFFLSPEEQSILAQEERAIKEAVGECLLSWADIEATLAEIFYYLLESFKDQTAFLIWDSIISFEAKSKVVNSVFHEKITNTELLYVWEILYKKIGKAVIKRNEIAHSTIFGNYSNFKPSEVFLAIRFTHREFPQKKLSPPQIKEITASFKHLLICLEWIRLQLSPIASILAKDEVNDKPKEIWDILENSNHKN